MSSTAFVSEIKLEAVLLHSKKRGKTTANRTNSASLFLDKGAATIKEFYARNSRWTEGLISAAKAVGWGATEMVYVVQNIVACISCRSFEHHRQINCYFYCKQMVCRLISKTRVNMCHVIETVYV